MTTYIAEMNSEITSLVIIAGPLFYWNAMENGIMKAM